MERKVCEHGWCILLPKSFASAADYFRLGYLVFLLMRVSGIWWKLNPKVNEASTSHAQTFLEWKELEIRLAEGKVIDKVEQELIKKEAKK